MSVGTMPLTIQVPDIPPMRKSMSSAVPMDLMFSATASSSTFQGVWYTAMEMVTTTAAANRRATWLAPDRESEPKKRMTHTMAATRAPKGIRAAHQAGLRGVLVIFERGEPESGGVGQDEFSIVEAYSLEGIVGYEEISVQVGEVHRRAELCGRRDGA